MHRFYCPDLSPQSPTVTISDPQEIHHLKNVLKLHAGDKITVFDGKGNEVYGFIKDIHKGSIIMKKVSAVIGVQSPGHRICLACAIPKKTKFEWIIEKSTELGIDEIIPLKTHRTEIRLSSQRILAKTQRYQTVALNAAKQCQRSFIPQIFPIQSLPETLKIISPKTLGLIPCLTGERKNLLEVQSLIRQFTKIIVFIGPEGDFTPEEILMAQQAGCIPVSLGNTILKVETAALAVVAYLNLLRN